MYIHTHTHRLLVKTPGILLYLLYLMRGRVLLLLGMH